MSCIGDVIGRGDVIVDSGRRAGFELCDVVFFARQTAADVILQKMLANVPPSGKTTPSLPGNTSCSDFKVSVI